MKEEYQKKEFSQHTLRIETDTYIKLVEEARITKRSVNAMINVLIEKGLTKEK